MTLPPRVDFRKNTYPHPGGLELSAANKGLTALYGLSAANAGVRSNRDATDVGITNPLLGPKNKKPAQARAGRHFFSTNSIAFSRASVPPQNYFTSRRDALKK